MTLFGIFVLQQILVDCIYTVNRESMFKEDEEISIGHYGKKDEKETNPILKKLMVYY